METRANLDKESCDTPLPKRSKSRAKIAVVRAIESFVDTIMYNYNNVIINLY